LRPSAIGVDAVDLGHDCRIVVARKYGSHDDHGVGRLRPHEGDDGLQALRDILDRGIDIRRHAAPDIISAGEQNDHFGVEAVEFTVLQAPEDVLDPICTPAEIGSVPAEEVGLPVLEQLRIIRGTPSARDRVAFEVDIDAALFGLFEELLVRQLGVLIHARRGLIGLGPQHRRRGDAGNQQFHGRAAS
jgi:hypothetical protein